jgi:hypothetical protein
MMSTIGTEDPKLLPQDSGVNIECHDDQPKRWTGVHDPCIQATNLSLRLRRGENSSSDLPVCSLRVRLTGAGGKQCDDRALAEGIGGRPRAGVLIQDPWTDLCGVESDKGRRRGRLVNLPQGGWISAGTNQRNEFDRSNRSGKKPGCIEDTLRLALTAGLHCQCSVATRDECGITGGVRATHVGEP